MIYLFVYAGIFGLAFIFGTVITLRSFFKQKFEHFDAMVAGIKEIAKDLVAVLLMSVVWFLVR